MIFEIFLKLSKVSIHGGPSCSWSHGSSIVIINYAISAYKHQSCEFEFRSWRGVLDSILCDKVCQRLAAGQWFSPFSST